MPTRISCAYNHETAFCSLTHFPSPHIVLGATIWPQMIKISCVRLSTLQPEAVNWHTKTTDDDDKIEIWQLQGLHIKAFVFSLCESSWYGDGNFRSEKVKAFDIVLCCNNCRKQNYRMRIVFRTHTVRCVDRNASWQIRHSNILSHRRRIFNVRSAQCGQCVRPHPMLCGATKMLRLARQ